MKIFDKYPPLTIRLYNQFAFFKACLTKNLFFKVYSRDDLYSFSINRKLKLSSELNIINKFNNKKIDSNFFYVWLSGFMEIKGSFLVNIKKNSSYSYLFLIEHNCDYFILYKIYKLYNINVKIKNINNMSYILRTSNKNILNSIINHCVSYPLQGEKFKLLNQFIKMFYK
jgi:hypothetical protein